ncbi:MAG: cell division protein ZapA [Desulfomicrobium sp.]|jgi:cell division protein ZapA|nr:cell division protein ZapA [Desulfomicrobium sp.]NLV97509.1 cell division protein ZapA [Desulfovibrionales bacterium]
MPEYAITILGLDLTFRTNVPEQRINQAVDLIHERFKKLEERGGTMSKERLLTYLALSLADDYLHDQEKLQQHEQVVHKLLSKIDDLEK